jgi:large subunit ribosomal protein L18
VEPQKKREARKRRHIRVRRKIVGNSQRPRLTVYRSLRHIFAQIIDDHSGNTLIAASTLDPQFKTRKEPGKKTDAAKAVGQLLAEKALEKQIKQVVFDRRGFKYHGRVKALAEGAREKGLEF